MNQSEIAARLTQLVEGTVTIEELVPELTLEPVTVECVTNINGVEYKTPFAFSDEPGPMVRGVLGKGISELLRDAGSTTKGSAQKKAEAIVERNNKIIAGDYVFGAGRGGGSRKTPEDEAWILFANSQGIKEDGKAVNKGNLVRAQKTLCRRALLAEHDAGTDERKDVEANIGKYLEERFDAWVAEQQESNPILKMGIEFQTMLAAQKKMG